MRYDQMVTRRTFERMTYESEREELPFESAGGGFASRWEDEERACASGFAENSLLEDSHTMKIAPCDEVLRYERAGRGAAGPFRAVHGEGRLYLSGPSMPVEEMSPQELGDEGERIAATYLDVRGFDILEHNWICPAGEADLIARDGDTVVFVEVKTRFSKRPEMPQMPELAVDRRKQERYRRIATTYLSLCEGTPPVRFDVIAVVITSNRTVKIHHLVDAFECDA